MNARQKKKQAYKHIKHEIIHMKPTDLLVIKPDLNEIDFDTVIGYVDALVKGVKANVCNVAILPFMEIEKIDVDVAEAYVNKLLTVVKEMREKNDELP